MVHTAKKFSHMTLSGVCVKFLRIPQNPCHNYLSHLSLFFLASNTLGISPSFTLDFRKKKCSAWDSEKILNARKATQPNLNSLWWLIWLGCYRPSISLQLGAAIVGFYLAMLLFFHDSWFYLLSHILSFSPACFCVYWGKTVVWSMIRLQRLHISSVV